MIPIYNKEYVYITNDIEKLVLQQKAVAIFNSEDANNVFKYNLAEFVIALDENTNQFGYCHNMQDINEFYKK